MVVEPELMRDSAAEVTPPPERGDESIADDETGVKEVTSTDAVEVVRGALELEAPEERVTKPEEYELHASLDGADEACAVRLELLTKSTLEVTDMADDPAETSTTEEDEANADPVSILLSPPETGDENIRVISEAMAGPELEKSLEALSLEPELVGSLKASSEGLIPELVALVVSIMIAGGLVLSIVDPEVVEGDCRTESPAPFSPRAVDMPSEKRLDDPSVTLVMGAE